MKKTFRIKRFYDTDKLNKNQVIKKVIFSAIAMIAFVGTSLANTVAVEEEKKTEQVDCVAVAIAALDAADPNNTMTQKQVHAFYTGQYDACIKSTGQLTHNVN